MSERLRLLLAVALAVVVRAPLWAESLRTPLDGDAAILGLMARHPLASVTMWGQPYGSPVEAWLVAPFVWVLGPTTAAVRIPGFLLGLSLVPLAWALARALDRRAAVPAALLVACPSSYLLLLAALPPPLYPTALALAGLLLVQALGLGERLQRGERPWARLVLWGALAGLALWTHLMTAPCVLAGAACLAVRTPRNRRALLLVVLISLVASSAPWWGRALGDPGASRALGLAVSPAEALRRAATVLPRVLEPLSGVLGAHAPWLADISDPLARTPTWAAALLLLLQAVLFALAAGSIRSSGIAWVPLVAITLTVLAFPLSRRAGVGDLRFLSPLYLPAMALLAWALVRRLPERAAYGVVGLAAALHLTGGVQLLSAWRQADRAGAPFHLPDLAPVRRLLEDRGIRSAYASYGPAYRLTYESGEWLIVSQFRNERFPDHPLPLLDEVRLAARVAWILTPAIPSDMPTPAAFESDLRVAGGSWDRTQAGPAVVFDGFVPPFSPTVVPLEAAGRAGDGDLATAVVRAGPGAVAFELPAQALDAVTLLAPLDGPRLPRGLDVEVSADGAVLEIVARRRKQRERLDLVWAGGQPQYLLEPDLLSVPLGGRRVGVLVLRPAGTAVPWALGEVLLHPAAPGSLRPWDDAAGLPAAWSDRRAALAAQPLRDRADWYTRVLIAARHP